MVRRSRCMGGHLTDLMTVRSGTGKDFKKKHVRKLKYCFTQYDGKHCFKFCSFRKDKNSFSMGNEHGEVYARFVLTLCVFDFDFVFRFCIFFCLSETAAASSSHKV